MSYRDRTITCADCRRPFAFAAEAQGLFGELGFETPKRCRPCLQSRETARRYPFSLLPLAASAPSRAQRN